MLDRAMHDKDRAIDANPSMLATLMAAAAGYAVKRGLPLDGVAGAAGLPPHALIAGPERVPEDAVSRILELLQTRFPDDAVGLELAASAPLSFMGPLEPIARQVPDVRAGIETFVHFRSVLSTSFELEFVEADAGPMLRFDHPNDRTFGPQGAEMGLAMGARAITEVLGAAGALRAVWFAHAPAAPIERYAEHFSAPTSFREPCNALLFHADRLGEPVDPAAGARFRVLHAHLELVRQQLEHDETPAELRRMRDVAARNAARGEYGAEALARSLGMSLRTLQRRVTEQGTSVSALVDGVRAVMARQLLADLDLSLYEVTIALGYTSESAFRRAFRRWMGQSPAAYRRASTASS
ncbi:MAG: AraC family transcriptional regulator ligand-binding domain-containing protein [Myxococcota bacterium]